MNIFTKKQTMTWAIIILVFLNIMALTTIFVNYSRKPNFLPQPLEDQQPGGLHHFLKQELNLSENQMERFKKLGDRHRERIRLIQESIQRLKREMMEEIFADSPDQEIIKNLSQEIGREEAQRNVYLFLHFKDLSSVCDLEQRKKFKVLMYEVLDGMKGPETKKPPGDRIPFKKKPLEKNMHRKKPPKKKPHRK